MTLRETLGPREDQSSPMSSWDDDDSSTSSSSSYDSYRSAASSISDSAENRFSSRSAYPSPSSFSLNTVIPSGFFSLRQRRRYETRSYDKDEGDEEKGRKYQQQSPQHCRNTSQPNTLFQRLRRQNKRKRDVFLCRCSSCALLISIIIWLNVRAFYHKHPEKVKPWKFTSPNDHLYARSVQDRFSKRERPPPLDDPSWIKKMWNNRKKNKEDLPEGCVLQEWQNQTHPSCNVIHELDLEARLGLGSSPSAQEGKYISSGLWRDVYSIPLQKQQAVMKMMKMVHDVDNRNLERHRREAAVMDVLTKSPNIVDLFAFCGNTVLTEYLPMDLDRYLKLDEKRDPPHHQGRSRMQKGLRHSPAQRLDLALQTAKALKDLHDYDVMHADLSAKQFLVSSTNSNDDGGDTITVKLNDFNRCRFLPRKPVVAANITKGNICPVRIPSAPGKSRSPEEYELKELTTQIDIYSLANVWFQILTEDIPWKNQRNKNQVKELIMSGQKPPLPDWLTQRNESSSDTSVAILMSLAYELDPKKRATANDLVQEVGRLIKDYN